MTCSRWILSPQEIKPSLAWVC
ncbi:rCG37160, partial [Rattus norvegicus]